MAVKILSSGYLNERQPSRVMFLDIILSRLWKRSLSNRIRELTLQCSFQRSDINPEVFEKTQIQLLVNPNSLRCKFFLQRRQGGPYYGYNVYGFNPILTSNFSPRIAKNKQATSPKSFHLIKAITMCDLLPESTLLQLLLLLLNFDNLKNCYSINLWGDLIHNNVENRNFITFNLFANWKCLKTVRTINNH